ncbi:MAG: hypothetical protein Q8L48_13940 [Archangium sp.]|nr:hypothetical protein [Archangium sp.]
MKLNFRVVTLSFCPDMVDPNAVSIPIAVLVVGKSDTGTWTALAMGVDVKKLGIDPLLGAMLSDVPNLVRAHFDAAMKRVKSADATPEAVLREFHEVLRTNIHVSSLSDEQHLEVADAMKLSHQLFDVAIEAFKAQWKASVPTLELPAPAWKPMVDPRSLLDVPPAHMLWAPSATVSVAA